MNVSRTIGLRASLFLFVMGIGIPSGLAQTADGPRLAIQADGLVLSGLRPNGAAASPFLAFELSVLSRMSLRIGLSPPLGQQTGQQAFATNLALNVWLGKGPGFLEAGIGSYYQNTWCNGIPDYRAYLFYLGWRHVSKSIVFRLGGVGGLTPDGQFVFGIGLGFGRAPRGDRNR